MEEKERFINLHYLYDLIEVYDNKLNSKRLMGIRECFDLLNQQDKRIKELESENNVGEFWHSAYQGKQLEYDQIYMELRKSYEENQQLKQSQKQLAISELEKVKNYFDDSDDDNYDESEGLVITNRSVVEYIDNQIKKLKGGKND